ncbi:hypothetical protein CALCODRAFT_540615 [Calocera cornea HHB12733]|uniref:Uncharacterized protein n=1 Tax=Calocera cornea HHB12733 TaxID=1353952 RepID=A0A165GGS8_9BASI|nr:hypothetical protein CALCODRAFT_540615 [Calocera cornea HHB12733]
MVGVDVFHLAGAGDAADGDNVLQVSAYRWRQVQIEENRWPGRRAAPLERRKAICRQRQGNIPRCVEVFRLQSLAVDLNVALAQLPVQATLEDVGHDLRVNVLAGSVRGKQLCSLLIVELGLQLRDEPQVPVLLAWLAVLQARLVAVRALLQVGEQPSVSRTRVHTAVVADFLDVRYELDALDDFGEGWEGAGVGVVEDIVLGDVQVRLGLCFERLETLLIIVGQVIYTG